MIYRTTGRYGRVEAIRESIFASKEIIYRKYLSQRKILDVGCGYGKFLQKVCDRYGADGIGLDLSMNMLSYAKKHYSDYSYLLANSAQLPFQDKSFDVVTFNGVFHHLPPSIVDSALSEAKRIAREYILIEEPCAFSGRILGFLSRTYWKVVDSGYVYRSAPEWRKYLEPDIVDSIEGEGFVRYILLIVNTRNQNDSKRKNNIIRRFYAV